jgi:phosphonopyruvate decarboxylase
MRRDHALQILKPLVDTQIVVAVYQTLFDWMVIHPRDLNYVATGAMGQASSHGLGLALANPEREVLVFDGDGSLLMNLGALVSIANAAPANLHHFVFVNEVYEVNGAHPIPGAGKVDFAGLARAAGYREAVEFSELGAFAAGVADFLARPGPAFAVLRVIPGESYPRDYDYIHSAAARERFRRALAAS